MLDDLSPNPAPARTYRAYPEAVWKEARLDYAEGWSAKEVCTRYDLGLSALRTRARKEGWRRADLVDEEPLPCPGDAPPEALPLMELVELAWRRASEAIARGKVYEARAWMRLTGELRLQIKSETSEAEHRESLPAKNIERAEKGWPPLAPSLHPLHPISRVQSAPDPAPDSPRMIDPVRDKDGARPQQADRRGVALFPNLKHMGCETAHGEQGGGDAEADDERVHRPSTAPNDRGSGGTTPCEPG